MIIKVVKVNSTDMAVAFSGDPKVEWFVKDLDGTNLPLPQIVSMLNGSVNLKFASRALTSTMRLGFYTEGESALAQDIDGVAQGSLFRSILSKAKEYLPGAIKKMLVTAFVVIGIGALISISKVWFPEATKVFSEYWKETSVLSVSDRIDSIDYAFIESADEKRMIALNSHPVYESEDIRAIEEELNINFRAMFKYVGSGVFLMEDLINTEDEAMLFEKSDAEDECSKIGSYLPTAEMIESIGSIRVNEWDNYPEWTDTNNGFGSDDYMILLKDGDLPDGAYKEDGKIYGDDGDVMAAARCSFIASDFE